MIKSERLFWVDCDEPGCRTWRQFVAMRSAQLAMIVATNCGWVQVDLGVWRCPNHTPKGTEQ